MPNAELARVEPLLLKPKDVALLLNCSIAQVYNLVNRHNLPHVWLGGNGASDRQSLRIPRESFIGWLNRLQGGAVAMKSSTRKRRK